MEVGGLGGKVILPFIGLLSSYGPVNGKIHPF